MKKLFADNDLNLRDIFRPMLENAVDPVEIDADLVLDAAVL